MNSKIKTIIIIVGVAIALVLVYIFFIKKSPTADTTLTSSSGAPAVNTVGNKVSTEETAKISKDFISLLLSVKSIKLDDSILKNSAFIALKDSSIVLMQDGNEGRPNPFAPIGDESQVTPVLIPGEGSLPAVDILNSNTNTDKNITTPLVDPKKTKTTTKLPKASGNIASKSPTVTSKKTKTTTKLPKASGDIVSTPPLVPSPDPTPVTNPDPIIDPNAGLLDNSNLPTGSGTGDSLVIPDPSIDPTTGASFGPGSI